MIYVKSMFRGNGIGSMLIQRVKEEAEKKQKGIVLYHLKELTSFYQANGFITMEDFNVSLFNI